MEVDSTRHTTGHRSSCSEGLEDASWSLVLMSSSVSRAEPQRPRVWLGDSACHLWALAQAELSSS